MGVGAHCHVNKTGQNLRFVGWLARVLAWIGVAWLKSQFLWVLVL